MTKTTLSEVAKQAIGAKKPTKADAHLIIQDLIQSNALSLRDAVALYTYFRPPIPKKAKTDMDWVAKAIGKGDVRAYLNYLYSTGDRIAATDGHRLHIIKNPDEKKYPEGSYLDVSGVVVSDVEDFGFKYPNIDRVIPPEDNQEEVDTQEVEQVMARHNPDSKLAEAVTLLPLPVEINGMRQVACSTKYFLDATNQLEEGYRLFVGLGDITPIIRVVHGNRTAIIMPLRGFVKQGGGYHE